MALWGLRDSFSISGTVAVVNTGSLSTYVIGTSTSFTANLEIGDSIQFPGGKRRKVTSIANDTYLVINTAWDGANLTGATITGQDSPKYVPGDEISGNLIFGVSNTEAALANNTSNGIYTPGWIRRQYYEDMHGNLRRKTEILVAVNTLTSDAADDNVVQDS